MSEKAYGYSTVLLSFGPLHDEDSLAAKSLEVYCTFILSIFNRDWDIITALISGTCAKNNAVTNSVRVEFIVCASHRFNFAFQDIFAYYDKIITVLNDLMKKLRNLIPAAGFANALRYLQKWKMKLDGHQLVKWFRGILKLVMNKKISLPDTARSIPTEDQEAQLAKLHEMLIQRDHVKKHCRERNL